MVVNLIHGPDAATVAGSDPASTDARVAPPLRDADIPGAAIAIVQDGHVVRTEGFGPADDAGRPVTADTPFAIGSLTKSMTALAVMQLADHGAIELDAPVLDYLPSFRFADPSATAAVTVRDLLDQTSGISTLAGRDALHRPVTTLQDQVASLAGYRPTAAPGTTYAYSNLNYAILGRLIEVVSGEPYGQYVSEHVFTPLGMDHTFTDLRPATAAGLAAAHRLWFGLPVEESPAFRADMVPAGYVLSSASDMGRYLAAMLDEGALGGVRVLSTASTATMMTGVMPIGITNDRYGLGWISGSYDGLPIVWHDGSTGDMASIAIMVPSRRLGIVLLANAQSVLYELMSKLDLIGYGAVAMLVGHAPSGTLAMLYPSFDALLLAVVLLQVRAVWRTVRQPARPRSGPLRRIPGWLWPLATCILWPALVLIEIPAVLGASWATLIQTDIGVAILVLVGLRIASGLVRARRWLRPRFAMRHSVRLEPAVE